MGYLLFANMVLHASLSQCKRGDPSDHAHSWIHANWRPVHASFRLSHRCVPDLAESFRAAEGKPLLDFRLRVSVLYEGGNPVKFGAGGRSKHAEEFRLQKVGCTTQDYHSLKRSEAVFATQPGPDPDVLSLCEYFSLEWSS